MSNPRVLIAGGGTGGHIIPALAVARELVARHSAEVLFVGTQRGMEMRLVPEAGFNVRLIDVGPLKNVSLATRLRTLLRLPKSILDCKALIREFQPGVVFGVGGYASGPAMEAALWLHVPAMAFEPNAMPGLANRLVGKRVQAAAVNFPAAVKWFNNCEVTGIPVRPEFFHLDPPNGPGTHLLIFGGSQGARIFNTHLPNVIPALLDAVPGLTVLHQTGARHLEQTREAYAAAGADPARVEILPFLDDMPQRFAAAHLVMARSGASTVAELAAAGKPSLLVPFAAAADEHQKRNAEAMVEAGAAAMLLESDLGRSRHCYTHLDLGAPGPSLLGTGDCTRAGYTSSENDPSVQDKLLNQLTRLLTNPQLLATMAAAARTQSRPGAAERIADRLADLAGQKSDRTNNGQS